MISPKHFLTTLKSMSSYPGLLQVFIQKKASFSSFIDSEFFSITLCVSFKKLVNQFKKFGTYVDKFGPTFIKKLLNSSVISFVAVIFSSITLFR